ncbi:hypothetical protein P8452_68824 [Trifolium repens]|nr:hypothetical protein P8452_68824 [Trifolium repens]
MKNNRFLQRSFLVIILVSLVRGVLFLEPSTFEHESTKNTFKSVGSSNENSVRPSSSRFTHPDEDVDLIQHSNETALGCSPEGLTCEDQNDENVNIKRMKFSLHELPCSRSNSEDVLGLL